MDHFCNEQLLQKIPNQFELVLIAAHRTKELMHGYPSKMGKSASINPVSTALDEIATGHIGREYLHKIRNRNFS
jgi:DNA-directed RNA polymerase omega subunit